MEIYFLEIRVSLNIICSPSQVCVCFDDIIQVNSQHCHFVASVISYDRRPLIYMILSVHCLRHSFMHGHVGEKHLPFYPLFLLVQPLSKT
jgi:hypothetical protein